jgi:phosphate transport system substrate-binding protein
MKKIVVLSAMAAVAGWSMPASAVYSFQGSDSLAGVMSDAVIKSGMNKEIAYTGGGSGKGEDAIVKGDQGIAPMSREMKPEMADKAKARGVIFKAYVIGLDGVGVFVNASNATTGMDLDLIRDIFTCVKTDWRDVPGSNKSGRINAFRRNDKSGTTDTFKTLVGIKTFGACVTAVEETPDIAEKTSKDANAIGFAGHTAKTAQNKNVKVARAAGQPMVDLNVNTVRNFSYPLARKLFVYEATGAAQPNATEAKFLKWITKRTNLDPIIQDNEYYTID